MEHNQLKDEDGIKRKVKDANEIDHQIGKKIYQCRVAMGLTRQELANKIGVTHQQLQKYEQGANRVAVSRLVDIAAALNVSVIYFFEDDLNDIDFEKTKQQRLCIEVMKNFLNIKRIDQQEAIRQIVKVLAKPVNNT